MKLIDDQNQLPTQPNKILEVYKYMSHQSTDSFSIILDFD